MSLFPTFQFGSIDLASYPFAVEFGSDRGTAAAVVERVASALRNGSLTRVTRYDNRTVTIPLLIEGPTMVDLADAEALLVAEASKPRNEFTFNPGDGWAADSVFDTFAAELIPQYDDDLELNGYRRFELTFEAHPHPRSAAKVITPAVATASATVVNAGSATTDWSSLNGVVTVISGAVVSTYSGLDAFARLVLTATVDTSVQSYIAIDWKASVPSYHAVRVTGSTNLAEVRREPAPTAGYTRSWYRVSGSTTGFILLDIVHPAVAGSQTLSIDQVIKAETLPVTGTARQLTKTIDPGGSVPAEGDIIVEHPTAGLGHAIVYSHPITNGYSPPLRQWLHSSAEPTASPTNTYSGAFHSLTTPTLYWIPTDSIPEGDVQLWARVQRTAATGLTAIEWKAQSGLASGADVGDAQAGTTNHLLTTNTWTFVPLARLSLPVSRINSGTLGIEIAVPSGGVIIDEAWLFAMDKGRLTIVQCGDGTPTTGVVNNRLRISAPSPEQPNGSIMIGTAADFSDAYVPSAAQILCDQVGHRFDPGGSMVFTAIVNEDAAVSLEHYPRWHTNAAS